MTYTCNCNDGPHPESDYREVDGQLLCCWCKAAPTPVVDEDEVDLDSLDIPSL